MKNPRKVLANPNAYCYGIGDFYVELTAHLFGGAILPRSNVHIADIDHEDWDARLEVKSGGSSANGVNVFVEQLEEYLERLGKGREHCLYFIYRYAARKHQPEERISHSARTVASLYRELAERTLTLHVVDARILNALRTERSKSWRDNHLATTITLWQYTLDELVTSVPLLTRIVGFRRGHFKVLRGHIRTVFEARTMDFPCSFVVPRRLERRIAHRLETYNHPVLNFD